MEFEILHVITQAGYFQFVRVCGLIFLLAAKSS